MKLQFLGHATFLVEVNGKKVLIDPFITSNPLVKGRVKVKDIECDYILITHGHIDHVEDLEEIYKNQDRCVLVSTIELVNYYKKKGLSRCHPMNPGGKWKFDFGTLYVVPECHANSLPDGTYGGSALGFIIEANGKTIYYAGDTALHHDMKHIPLFHKLDYGILPIGGCFTMDIDQAVVAAKYIGTDNIIPMHFDTNPMIEINKNYVNKKAEEANVKLRYMDIGETIDV